jgi:hypothetical protein
MSLRTMSLTGTGAVGGASFPGVGRNEPWEDIGPLPSGHGAGPWKGTS